MNPRRLPLIEKGNAYGSGFSMEKKGLKPSSHMLFFYSAGVFIFFLIVLIRLFQLTVVKGAYFSMLARNNRVREVIIEAPRGDIIDRKGVKLVTTEESSKLAENKMSRINQKRLYLEGAALSHILGYRQIADIFDLKKDPCLSKLKLGDKTGKAGIEKLYECELRGANGKILVEVDAKGKYTRTLDVVPPKKGQNLTIALDIKLMAKAQELMRGKKGAVVGVIPKTGEVILMLSSPWYDPQVFEDGDAREVKALLADEDRPMYNRAVEGNYPPGSVFKPFVAAAGLEEGVIRATDTINDEGVIKAGAQNYYNWYFLDYGRAEGEVDLLKAIQRSNDTYFYLLGGKLGPEKIKNWAERFGFANITGIGVPESQGIIPSSFWKKDTLGEDWYLGDTYNLSIGQGYVSTTPLQIAMATSVFANGGSLCKPQLLKKPGLTKIETCAKLPFSEKTYNTVREGMKLACETGGTGWPFFDFGIKTSTQEAKQGTSSADLVSSKIAVGCKTGTAESHAKSGKPHAWFTVFAPYDNPEIALAVLVEEGGQGSDTAAPIAKEILKTYFERTQ